MESTCTKIYKTLNESRSEIRLLEPVSDDTHGGYHYRLSTESLDANPVFTALSYVWGDPNDREPIILDGQTVQITRNLKLSLPHIRRHWAATHPDRAYHGFKLWVDAICINQDDNAERSQQVQLMRRIYGSADAVVSWLGPDDQDTAFGTVKILAEELAYRQADGPDLYAEGRPEIDWMQRYPALCKNGTHGRRNGLRNDAWSDIAGLLEAPYWDRVWIFQEVVLARRLLLVSPGNTSLNWHDLAAACIALSRLRERTTNGSLTQPNFISASAWTGITTPMVRLEGITNLAHARTSTRVQSTTEGSSPEILAIATFASSLRATNPKDYIYGLLGLTRLPITPDYTDKTSLSDVYTEFVVAWLDASQKGALHRDFCPLQFLSNGGIGLFGQEFDLPTWAPNYPARGRGGTSSTRVAGGSADRGVFPSNDDKFPYVVAASKSLFTWGVKVDHVTSVVEGTGSDALSDGRMLKFIVNFIIRYPIYRSGIPPLQAIFRLLTRDPSGIIDKAVVTRAITFLWLLTDGSSAKDRIEKLKSLGLSLERPDFDNQLANSLFPGIDFRQIGLEQSPREIMGCMDVKVLRGTWGLFGINLAKIQVSWRFVTTSSGYLGLAPVGTVPGDLLCILKGSQVPVILRKALDETYMVVGTVFVVGLMNGEAVSLTNQAQSTTQWFELK